MADEKGHPRPEGDAEGVATAPPYTVLAAGYDVVMAHVEYDAWASYVHMLLQKHHPAARDVLELGCGTGSFAFELQPLGDYRYAGTDRSAAMVEVARRKAELYGADAVFEVADFTDYRVEPPVDAVILLYDGLNYLLEPEPVQRLMDCTFRALKPGGVFIVDQSTPANSVNNEAYFEDAGDADAFSYVRKSKYDAGTGLHTTTLDLTVDGTTYRELHVQRAYAMDEVRTYIEAAGFHVAAAYDSFSTLPATPASERIHWVLRRPTSSVPPEPRP